MKKIRYYHSFDEEFTENSGQDFTIEKDYRYIRDDFFEKLFSSVLYSLFFIFGFIYCKAVLHIKVAGREKIKSMKENFFLFGNHTQPIGDVFLPSLIVFPKRFFAVASSANLGIPLIGRLLPYLGALPLPKGIKDMRRFSAALSQRFSQGYPIVIYPETHVWEYMKDIRPFDDASLQYPAKENAAVFTFCTTYTKSRFHKRPKATVYIDGPFYPDTSLDLRKRRQKLHSEVFSALTKRAKLSNTEYIEYKKRTENI